MPHTALQSVSSGFLPGLRAPVEAERISDPDYDDVLADFSEDGQITLIQKDEGGNEFAVILSDMQLSRIADITLWNRLKRQPPSA